MTKQKPDAQHSTKVKTRGSVDDKMKTKLLYTENDKLTESS